MPGKHSQVTLSGALPNPRSAGAAGDFPKRRPLSAAARRRPGEPAGQWGVRAAARRCPAPAPRPVRPPHAARTHFPRTRTARPASGRLLPARLAPGRGHASTARAPRGSGSPGLHRRSLEAGPPRRAAQWALPGSLGHVLTKWRGRGFGAGSAAPGPAPTRACAPAPPPVKAAPCWVCRRELSWKYSFSCLMVHVELYHNFTGHFPTAEWYFSIFDHRKKMLD